MKKLLLTLTTLSLLHTAQAEIMEGNVNIQLKITRQLPQTVTDKAIIQKESVTTFKNADFIQAMSAIKGGTPFSKSAKLMFNTGGETGLDYFIRDKGKDDFPVTNYLSLDTAGDGYILMIGTMTKATPSTGKSMMSSFGELTIRLEDPEVDDMILRGPLVSNLNIIQSKEDPRATYGTGSFNMSGYGSLLYNPENPTPDKGLIQGTVKLNLGKVLPTRPEEPEV